MGHGHSRPAGWNCRCGSRPPVPERMCVCTVHSSAPETFPALGFCVSSSTHQVLESQAYWTGKPPVDD